MEAAKDSEACRHGQRSTLRDRESTRGEPPLVLPLGTLPQGSPLVQEMVSPCRGELSYGPTVVQDADPEKSPVSDRDNQVSMAVPDRVTRVFATVSGQGRFGNVSTKAPTFLTSTPVHWLGQAVIDAITAVGDLTLFSLAAFGWFFSRPIPAVALWPNLYRIGVLSVPVIVVTGGFIGMVLAVQTFDQLRVMHLENRIGSVINLSLVKELGPVLAATMLAGRVGSSMAAELGTMRVTEQIDALTALGANPIHFLVTPRVLGCVVLIPMLTLIADGVGILAGWGFSTAVLGIDSFYYWHHTYAFVGVFDVFSGALKSLFFGGVIGVISCHRGFHTQAGAEGVGRAATESFVYSFAMILFLDFLLGVFLSKLYEILWGF